MAQSFLASCIFLLQHKNGQRGHLNISLRRIGIDRRKKETNFFLGGKTLVSKFGPDFFLCFVAAFFSSVVSVSDYRSTYVARIGFQTFLNIFAAPFSTLLQLLSTAVVLRK